MQIRIDYRAQARTAAGVESESVALPDGASVLDLLERLGERRAPLRPLLLAPDGSVRPSLLVFVGGAQVSEPAGRALADGDDVLILAPMSGG